MNINISIVKKWLQIRSLFSAMMLPHHDKQWGVLSDSHFDHNDFSDLNRSYKEFIAKHSNDSFIFFCTGILGERKKGSNKLLHIPIEHEKKKRQNNRTTGCNDDAV